MKKYVYVIKYSLFSATAMIGVLVSVSVVCGWVRSRAMTSSKYVDHVDSDKITLTQTNMELVPIQTVLTIESSDGTLTLPWKREYFI
jgi:hypothetical protein